MIPFGYPEVLLGELLLRIDDHDTATLLQLLTDVDTLLHVLGEVALQLLIGLGLECLPLRDVVLVVELLKPRHGGHTVEVGLLFQLDLLLFAFFLVGVHGSVVVLLLLDL
jgi:hypothetical protein